MENTQLRKPYVTAFVTMSVDGKIASRSGDSRLSCPFDKKRLHELRATSDGVMVGANTVRIDDPLLTPRLVQVEKPPARIVVDGKLTLTPTYRVFKVKDAPTYLITSSKTPESKLRKFEDIGVNVIKAPEKDDEVNLNYALSELYGKGVKHILVEGGGNLIWSLLKQNLIDELRVTISPFIIGGKAAITPVEGEGFTNLGSWVRLELLNYFLCECGQEIHLVYRVKH